MNPETKYRQTVSQPEVTWDSVAAKVAGPYFLAKPGIPIGERLGYIFDHTFEYWQNPVAARRFGEETDILRTISQKHNASPDNKPRVYRLPDKDRGMLVPFWAFYSSKALELREIGLMVEDNDQAVTDRLKTISGLGQVLQYQPPVANGRELAEQLESYANLGNRQVIPPRIAVVSKHDIEPVVRGISRNGFRAGIITFCTNRISQDTVKLVEQLTRSGVRVVVWKKSGDNEPIVPDSKSLNLYIKEVLQPQRVDWDGIISQEKLKEEIPADEPHQPETSVVREPNIRKSRVLSPRDVSSEKPVRERNQLPASEFKTVTGIDLSGYNPEDYGKFRARLTKRLWRELADQFRDHPELSFAEICRAVKVDPEKNRDRFRLRFRVMADEFKGIQRGITAPVQYLMSQFDDLKPVDIISLPGADFLTSLQWKLLGHLSMFKDEETLLDLTYSDIARELKFASITDVKNTLKLIVDTIKYPENRTTPRAIFLKATGVDLGRPGPGQIEEIVSRLTDPKTKKYFADFESAMQIRPNASYEQIGLSFDVPTREGARGRMDRILNELGVKQNKASQSPENYVQSLTGLTMNEFAGAVLENRNAPKFFNQTQLAILKTFLNTGAETYTQVSLTTGVERSTVKFALEKAVLLYQSDRINAEPVQNPKTCPYQMIREYTEILPEDILKSDQLRKVLDPAEQDVLNLLCQNGGREINLYRLGRSFSPPIPYPELQRMIRRIGILVKRVNS